MTASTAYPSAIRFSRAICGDLGQAERREWWLANGLGAYGAGTIAGSLTRRYHGLLIAPIALNWIESEHIWSPAAQALSAG